MIDRSFFEKDSETVAQKLLGKLLCRKMPNGEVYKMVIMETEAYPANDSCCYGYGYEGNHGNKKKTAANAPLFKIGGTCCIYGGMILIDGEVCAFTIAAPQNDYARDILFEKAFFDLKGLYQIIFNEFCKNRCSGYKYINREEDLGIEGLRKSKLSYNPIFLTDKYEANCKA